jgi:hypothetical protein
MKQWRNEIDAELDLCGAMSICIGPDRRRTDARRREKHCLVELAGI